MTENAKSDLKEYAGGWITERKETEIPGFLKLAFPIILCAMLTYLIIYMNGEVHNATRGTLVQQLNAVTGTADTFMYAVAAMIVVYAIILLAFLFSKKEHEDQ